MPTPEQKAEMARVAKGLEGICDHYRNHEGVDARTLISCLSVQLQEEIFQAYREWPKRKHVLAQCILALVGNFEEMKEQEESENAEH